ncbi:MAG TPA: TonB-dependent receptor plug domain-containing protein, partial [Chitinophagaceae bacterium]|nr:TonB-dependent receptor plug domain-containing protein [Chitinophagaceae bacterium]
MKHILFLAAGLLLSAILSAQVRGRIIDGETREPLEGATIISGDQQTLTSAKGEFLLPFAASEIKISFTGYESQVVSANKHPLLVSLIRIDNNLDEVVLSANRTSQRRREAPVAIASIGKQIMNDTKATRLDELLNKISGVNMVNLGNEQHEMSIRQPMTTKSLFLYLEDGIPIRTTGLYNHNALLEMNLPAARQIEVIKGPASSIYGAEAIGGAVNVITQSPPAFFTGMASIQVNNAGYKRGEWQVGNTTGKFGLLISGY